MILAISLAGPAFSDPMAMDSPSRFGGLEAACTGVGDAKDDPRWLAYPVRIEFSNGGAQNLSGAHVALSEHGRAVADFDCGGPWVVLRGTPATYRVTATITGSTARPAHATFSLGKGPQRRVVLRFPEIQPNQ